MRELSQSRFASTLTIILGIWLLVSPIFISITGAALVSLLITGAIITLAGLVQLAWENSVPSWIVGLAAIWLFISALGYTVSGAVVWNQVIFAIIAFALAIWDGIEISTVQNRHHAGMA